MKSAAYQTLVKTFDAETAPFLVRSTLKARSIALESYGKHITPFGGQEVGVKSVTAWTQRLIERGLSPNTVILWRTHVRALFNWAAAQELWKEPNPVRRIRTLIPQPSEREAMTFKEYRRLVETEAWQGRFLWMPLILQVAWETGLRMADCCCLRWNSIDMEARLLKITPQKKKRFGEKLTIPVDNLMPLLNAQKVESERPLSDYAGSNKTWVFSAAAAEYVTCGHLEISAAFYEVAQRLSIKKSFHCIRHAYVSRLLDKGVSIAVIRSLTGHSLAILQKYIHITPEQQRKALNDNRDPETD